MYQSPHMDIRHSSGWTFDPPNYHLHMYVTTGYSKKKHIIFVCARNNKLNLTMVKIKKLLVVSKAWHAINYYA